MTLPPAAPAAARVDLEWGVQGAKRFAGDAEGVDAVVVVDVLSFSTAVTVACERGARVWPHPGGEQAHALARSLEAVLAGTRTHRGGPSLSPTSLLELPEGTRLVLPSPNGSSICHALMGAGCAVLAGGLRNARAVARYVAGASRVAVVPAGERWSDGSLRFAYEDLVGAGAVVARLREIVPDLVLSPEAQVAALAFAHLQPLTQTASGIELVERDFAADVALASVVDGSDVVPVLRQGCFEPA